jgi:tRNA (adenine22-N1)-methyltransferase
MALSLRLALISALVPPGARVCDIGTDHGYLPIELIKRGDIKSVIATDIREKPLASAEKNIKAAGVSGITLRLCFFRPVIRTA